MGCVQCYCHSYSRHPALFAGVPPAQKDKNPSSAILVSLFCCSQPPSPQKQKLPEPIATPQHAGDRSAQMVHWLKSS
jgi:hypothetical protein